MSCECSFPLKADYPMETIVCGLLYLLSRQANNPDLQLQFAIRDHLSWLASHPEIDSLPQLGDTSAKLALYWNRTTEEMLYEAHCPQAQH